MKIIRILTVLMVLALFILSSIPISANTPDPDSAPTMGDIYIYHNLLEANDYFIIWTSHVNYATTPGTPFNETFVWRLMNLDGVSTMGSTTGYVYQDDGYGLNCFGMYWPAATAPTWGTVYTLKLSGNPANFTTPPIYNFALNSSDYTTLTTQSDNQLDLSVKVLAIANTLTTTWALPAGYGLVTQEATGNALSTYGQLVFRGAIYGVQALAPYAFAEKINTINVTDRSWNTTYQTQLQSQWSGTWVETAKNASISFFGTGWDLLGVILLGALCIGLLIANLSITNDPWNALIDVAFVLVIAARLEVYSIGTLALIAAICIVYIGMIIWRRIPGAGG
jgi:hypothetical protein